MNTSMDHHPARQSSWPLRSVFFIVSGLLVFCALFLFIDQANYRFVSLHFPRVGSSFWLATAWGVVSRAPWVLVILALVFMRPGLLGLQAGQMRSHWRLVLSIAAVNAIVVGAFLLLSGDSTPYSGNQWLLTEIVTVPLVEELFWRGLVFSALCALLQKSLGRDKGLAVTVWLSGIAFGLMHAGNALAGVPLQFVAVQTLNAAIWGVAYGYFRAKTDSVYPSILAHAAMNLVVILF